MWDLRRCNSPNMRRLVLGLQHVPQLRAASRMSHGRRTSGAGQLGWQVVVLLVSRATCLFETDQTVWLPLFVAGLKGTFWRRPGDLSEVNYESSGLF